MTTHAAIGIISLCATTLATYLIAMMVFSNQVNDDGETMNYNIERSRTIALWVGMIGVSLWLLIIAGGL